MVDHLSSTYCRNSVRPFFVFAALLAIGVGAGCSDSQTDIAGSRPNQRVSVEPCPSEACEYARRLLEDGEPAVGFIGLSAHQAVAVRVEDTELDPESMSEGAAEYCLPGCGRVVWALDLSSSEIVETVDRTSTYQARVLVASVAENGEVQGATFVPTDVSVELKSLAQLQNHPSDLVDALQGGWLTLLFSAE